jgi:hypothetical protein
MKKCVATAIYRGNTLYNVAVNTGNDTINFSFPYFPKVYRNFREIYAAVLQILANNGFSVAYYDDFNSRWYNIQWVELDNPGSVKRYGVPLTRG